jgi:hypothetical protein
LSARWLQKSVAIVNSGMNVEKLLGIPVFL